MGRLLNLSSKLGRAVRLLSAGSGTLDRMNEAGQATASGYAMHKSYTWEYRIDVAPYDKLMEVVEAFFCSYPGGDYSCEDRQRYKLRFRRGAWRKGLMGLGQLTPDNLAKGRFNHWPILVHVLVRPSPEVYMITLRYEVCLPKSVPSLIPEVQTSVDQHAQQELQDLSAYLAECIGLEQQPVVNPQQ